MNDTQVQEPAAVRADGGPRPAGDGPGSDSLFKNAYFLMLSTGVSAVLGLGFWLVAARYYSEDAVGEGSAAIAAMRLLASITATTMIGAVVRFVPRAGRETGRLVWGVYGASSVVVALAAGVFLLTLDRWGASYEPLGTPLAGALFVAACVAWALLTLQDGVLTGLRKAEWVPAGNAMFSVGKLVLLAVFASALPVLGIFASWAVAIAFSTLPLGWLIFRRLIPRQAAADRDVEPPALRTMGRFLAGDSLGALFSLAMINLLPVMVAVRFSAAENGYFYVAYTVGGTMEFMAINMASSLTAHASHDPRQLADGVRGALRRMTLLLVPVVAVLVIFAPLILTPFSADYAEHGSTVLRLLALGALPRVVVELYIGVLRVQGRTGVLAALQGAMCALVLGSAGVLFTPAGIAGAGWAVLISMTLIAAVSVFGLRAALRDRTGGPADRPPTGTAYGTRWARLNATAGYGTGWARRTASGDERSEESGEDTVTLFIGRPGYEREALQADTLAFIVRPQPAPGPGAGAAGAGEPAGGAEEGAGAGTAAADAGPDGVEERVRADERAGADGWSRAEEAVRADGRARTDAWSRVEEPGRADVWSRVEEPGRADEPVQRDERDERDAWGGSAGDRSGWKDGPDGDRSAGPSPWRGAPRQPGRTTWAAAAPPATASRERRGPAEAGAARPNPPRPSGGPDDRRLRHLLWAVLGLATLVFWASVRDLPRLDGTDAAALTGRQLLEGLPLTALASGGVLLLVFVASVTLSTRADTWLTGTALGSALVALHAAPVLLGREPEPVGGAFSPQTAGSLAEALGLDVPGPLLRWVPLVCHVLCLAALWPLLAHVGGRLSWPGRWGVLYLVAVGGWVARDALAPATPVLLALLVVLHTVVVRVLLPLLRRAVPAPPRRRPPSGLPED
ncbi:lipopolysaccharide biosynthesis protein [Streptomyces capillispiralis]|uniref:lipopolysaccharide biosynthesis protein n=1 Tax=Streptomyces capillispiralis TaxID=68182 RepID=UPI001E603509|nr:lipopolysaccharide biosynthesis protein [Streptomyces capillispiralis]